MPKLASSPLFGIGVFDSHERINLERMRRERAEKLRQTMRKYGIPACLLARGDNVRYATGIRGAIYAPMLSYCLFFAEDDPVIWEHPGRYHQIEGQAPWIKPENWRYARCWYAEIPGPEATHNEAKLFASDIEQELQQRGLKDEKLGTTSIDAPASAALNELGIKTVNFWPMMQETRAVKTQDEINCFKIAGALVDATLWKVYEALRPGVRDRDISGVAVKAALEAGAEEATLIPVWSGPYTYPRGYNNTDRIIQPDDMVYIDVHYLTHLGYRTCCYRTFKVGSKPTEKEKDWYKRVLETQNAVIDAIKPGATTADVAKYFPPASEIGFPDDRYGASMDVVHGIGLSGYELPYACRYFSFNYPQVFEAGMTLAVECSRGEFRVGGCRLEDMVVVTEDGAEIVNRWPRDEIAVVKAIV